eukprot:10326373-Alexandrium_andersonii.AAC.1
MPRKPAAIFLGRPRGGFPWGRCILPGSILRCSTSGVVTLLWGPPASTIRPLAPLPIRDLYLEERCSALPGSVGGRRLAS